MRDFLLNEALKRLAAEAATRFSTLVAGGDQIPFDVGTQKGSDSLFYSYEPLTAKFLADREDELRALPAFPAAREAVERAGLAAPYLEGRGERVPPQPGERASRMLLVFITSLWDGCTEFSLDHSRLDNALAVLDAEVRDADEADVLIAPLVGLRMPLARLDLPHGMQIVRADSISAPPEALSSEGMGRAAWEPQFLALAEKGQEQNSAEAALRQLRELVSVMRLFEQGGIGLGPYAFAPTGEGRWRRLPTGAAATRSGGYALNEQQATALAEFAAKLESRPDPDGALAWAIARFEMGCARESALEGLSDHLLSLRAVLDGHGPVGASVSMRAAALVCDGTLGRVEARERIEKALELERALMTGTPTRGAEGLAAWLESGTRRILCEAALGELGTDLGAVAEESLISTGLEGGDSEIAISAVGLGEEEEVSIPAEVEPPIPAVSPGEAEISITAAAGNRRAEDTVEGEHPHEEEDHMTHQTRIMEPVPADDEIRITAKDWLEEVEEDDAGEGDEATLDFPSVQGDLEHRERIDTPRVRHLFPVPEDADWEVRELNYDRRSRRAG